MTSTTAVTYDDDGTDTPDGSTEPPTESVLVRDIDLANKAFLKSNRRYWRQSEGDGSNYLIFNGITTLRTEKIPITSGIGYQVTTAIKPTNAYTTVPTIFEPHIEVILEYVRARAYMMKEPADEARGPYRNMRLGQEWMAEYRRSRSKIKLKAMIGFGGESRVRNQNFAM